MKQFKKLCLILMIACGLPLEANILLQKPESLSQEQLNESLKKRDVVFTWPLKMKRSYTFTYENGKAGFAFKFLSMPLYCKNYRIVPTVEEIKRYFNNRLAHRNPHRFTERLGYRTANPTSINTDELYSFIKDKKCIFYTGAGLSASGKVPMMNELMEQLHVDKGAWHFLKHAWRDAEQMQHAFADFCKAAFYGEPTQAHHTLTNIAQEKSVAILTENIDLLHQRTGIDPIHSRQDSLRLISPSEWQEVDAIICIGLSRDDCGLLAWYKQHNPQGKLIAIDLKTPNYLSDADFVCLGDLQEIFSLDTCKQYFQIS